MMPDESERVQTIKAVFTGIKECLSVILTACTLAMQLYLTIAVQGVAVKAESAVENAETAALTTSKNYRLNAKWYAENRDTPEARAQAIEAQAMP
jgi:hypothetical protein